MADPNRPRLHPWIPLLGRDDGRVMLARGPGGDHGFTATDSAAVLAAAQCADGRRSWEDLGADPLVARGARLLEQHGALVDSDEVAGGQDLGPRERALLLRARLSSLAGARQARVDVGRRRDLAATISGPEALAAPMRSALAVAGIPLPGSSRERSGAARLELVIGRPDWLRVRRWMVDGVAHLAISPRADSVRLGPLVIPGLTSCLQCLHLVRCDRYADWPSLWEQLQRAPVPEPDPVLVQHAAALAARCVVDYAQTGESAAMNASLQVSVDDLAVTTHAAPRHPLCGCWWPPAPIDG
jgi:hypothetical protein